MSNIATRIYQPNLTCAFDIMMTDDNHVWTLYMRNHDDIGITDEQFVQQVWAYANTFLTKLVERKEYDEKVVKEKDPPAVQSIVTHNFKYTMYSIIFAIEDEKHKISKTLFVVMLFEFCRQMCLEHGFKMEGSNGTKS